jgi:ATP-dependent exoDNAse (exonuclease V) beta subunit
MTMKPLNIYKASAGSGKTFRLAVEYIKLLVRNPDSYRHILAVTFTNKATAEMKQRILSQLYGVGHGLKESDGYLQQVMEAPYIREKGLDEAAVRERCRMALSKIAHDYTRFRIETIDSFFQSIIRELARELNLTANLRVDLNSKEVLAEAVAEIIDELPQDTERLKTFLSYINEKIDENKNWNPLKEIINFGGAIFKEEYLARNQDVREKISDSRSLVPYKKALDDLLEEKKRQLDGWYERFMEARDPAGLPMEGLNGQAGMPRKFFEKLGNGEVPNITSSTTINMIENGGAWFKKEYAEYNDTANEVLLPILREAAKVVEQFHIADHSVMIIRKHLNHLVILNWINSKVRTLNADANRFLLADTAHFLAEMIVKGDVPFIYERTGTRFHHIMIDEFQDTSQLQWNNFEPMLMNSLSQNHECLLVGDVKQSIYRWRNGDWTILNNIEKGDFEPYIGLIESHTNYRSAQTIVDFNNACFKQASVRLAEICKQETGVESDDILRAYEPRVLQQDTKESMQGKGLVSLTHIEVDSNGKDDAIFEQLERISDIIHDLVEVKGERVSDIAILLRYKKNIPDIINHFNEVRRLKFSEANQPFIRIVSDEAFRLDYSPAVTLIIHALRVLDAPDDHMALANLVFHYLKQTRGEGETEVEAAESLFLSDADTLRKLLPEAFSSGMEQLALKPLLLLVEELHSLFQVDRIPHQDAYMFLFLDRLTAYLADRPSDIHALLQYWDEALSEVTIANGSLEGIRILTIHKAKGLEYKHVIVPFCEWPMTVKSSHQIWCEPKVAPYDELPLAPVDCTKSAVESIFAADVKEEIRKTYVDNLNLLYVAFTRAENNLYGTFSTKRGSEKSNTKAKDGAGGSESKGSIADLLLQTLSKETWEVVEVDAEEAAEAEDGGGESGKDESEGSGKEQGPVVRSCKLGTFMPAVRKEEGPTANALQRTEQSEDIAFTLHPASIEFLQSNASAAFIQGESDDESDRSRQEYINRGLLVHRLLSAIRYPEDLERAIRQFDLKGLFPDSSTRSEIKAQIEQALAKPEVQPWFSHEWTVVNERCILFRDEQTGKLATVRPDRVITQAQQAIVIDYKTGKERPQHAEQVRQYMQHLHGLGYTDICGFVWYINHERIIEIQHTA